MIKFLKCIVVFVICARLAEVSALKHYYINVDAEDRSSYRVAFSLSRVTSNSDDEKQCRFGDLNINIYQNGDIIGQLPAVTPYSCLVENNQLFFDGIFRKYLGNMVSQNCDRFLENYGVQAVIRNRYVSDEIWEIFSKDNYSAVAKYNYAENDELTYGATLGQILTATTNWRMFFSIMKKKAGVFRLDVSRVLKNNIPIDWNCYAHTQYINDEMLKYRNRSSKSHFDFFACKPGVFEAITNGFRYFSEVIQLNAGCDSDIALRENSFKFFCLKSIDGNELCDENNKAQLAQTYAYISYIIDLMIKNDMFRVKMIDFGYYYPYDIEHSTKRESYRKNLLARLNSYGKGYIIDAFSDIELIQRTALGRLAKNVLGQARAENTRWIYFKDIRSIGEFLFKTDLSELSNMAGFKIFADKYDLSKSRDILSANVASRHWITYYSLEYMTKSVVLRALLTKNYTPCAYAYTPDNYTEKQHINNLRRIIKLIWHLNKNNIVAKLCIEAKQTGESWFDHSDIDDFTDDYETNTLLRVLVDLDILEPITDEAFIARDNYYYDKKNKNKGSQNEKKTCYKYPDNLY